MASATPEDIRVRIEDILRTITAVKCVLVADDAADDCVDGECPIPDDLLPAAIVLTRGANRTATSADMTRITRTFEIGVMAAKPCSSSVRDQRDAIKAAETFFEVIPTFFRRKARRLALNGVPLEGVLPDGVGEMADQGAEFRPWAGETYAGFTLSVAVTYKG